MDHEQQEKAPSGLNILLLLLMCALVAVVLMPPSKLGILYYVQAREHLTRILTGALGMVMCWAWIQGRARPLPGRGLGLLLAFVAHAALAVAWSQDKSAALEAVHGYACWLIAALAACEVFRARKLFVSFTSWVAIVALLAGGLGVLEKAGLVARMMPDVDSFDQIASTLGYPTYYAAWLLPAVFLVQAGFAAAEKNSDKGLCAVAFIVLCVNLWLCHSQAAMVFFAMAEALFLIGPFLVSVLRARVRGAPRALVSLLIVMTIALIFLAGSRVLWNRKQESMALRQMKWQVAGAMARDRPLAGFGPGQYPVHYPRYRAQLGLQEGAWETRPDIYYPVVTDNDLLLRVVEQGWPGAALFAVLIVWTVLAGAGRGADQSWRRAARNSLGAGVFAIAGFGLFHFPFESTGVWFPVWCCFAGVWVFSEKDSPQRAQAARIPAAASIILFCLMAYATYLPAGQWVNDTHMIQGFGAAAVQNQPAALRSVKNSAPLTPRTWRRDYYAGRTLLLIGRPRQAARPLRRAEELRPYNLAVLRWLRTALMHNPRANGRQIERVNRKIRMLDPLDKSPGPRE